MRQYFEDTKPITDRNGSLAMKAPLKATKGPDGHVCTLTQFTEAFRRGDVVSDPTEQEREAISLYLVPAVNALIDEALLRSGASIDDLQQERNRRRGMEYVKPQLPTDTIYFTKRNPKKQNSAPRKNGSEKQTQPKDPSPKRTPLSPEAKKRTPPKDIPPRRIPLTPLTGVCILF